jgi:hypothetical protein
MNEPMVKNLEEYLGFVARYSNEWSKTIPWHPIFWFRGHMRANWKLEPRWIRETSAQAF